MKEIYLHLHQRYLLYMDSSSLVDCYTWDKCPPFRVKLKLFPLYMKLNLNSILQKVPPLRGYLSHDLKCCKRSLGNEWLLTILTSIWIWRYCSNYIIEIDGFQFKRPISFSVHRNIALSVTRCYELISTLKVDQWTIKKKVHHWQRLTDCVGRWARLFFSLAIWSKLKQNIYMSSGNMK